jgi:hypothetical protein
MENIIKIQGIEFTESNLQELENKGKIFIVKASKIFQIHYSNAQKTYYATTIYRSLDGLLTKPGRFFAMDSKTVNNLLGFALTL